MIDKKDFVFERDGNSELIPEEVELIIDENNEYHKKFKGKKISIVPLTRGEIKKLLKDLNILDKDDDDDLDGDIIVKHVKNPVFTKEDKPFIRGQAASVLVNTVLYHSGLDIGKKTRRDALREVEDDFAKN